MSRWFRFYADAMRNPKVLRLSDGDFRLWVRLLAVASENNGAIPPLEDLKLTLGVRLDHLKGGLNRLISGGLIDALEDGYEPHNWSKFQYKSDTSNERVAKHRAARNVTVTPPDTEAETDKKETPPSAREAGDRKAVRDGVVAEWNAMALQAGLPVVSKLTTARCASLDARLAEHGRQAFTEAIARVAASPMCRGENARGWRANFDFLLQPSSFVKLMEGNYDGQSARSGTGRPMAGDRRDCARPPAPTGRTRAVLELLAEVRAQAADQPGHHGAFG